ncbi:Prophage protein [Lactiplantibacillus plantarum]|nr:Prophage protein [Lactiplantibacillus plantarum]MCG0744229.1 Prophage protein [Lactiplantibacillus plantarum]MCG0884785.1 Prophage protein [Lactiplantibacillus plantarum]
MEQSEFNTTQAINETCYGLIKQGYSLHDIYDGLGNVMYGIEPKHLSKQELVIDLNVDTSKLACKLRHAMDD